MNFFAVPFGLGVVCWIVLGSIILGRLLFGPTLPPDLQPTLAIEVAPAAVASLAWFKIHGQRIDTVTAAFVGYGPPMVLAQLCFVPMYCRSCQHVGDYFQPATVASTALVWLQPSHIAGRSCGSTSSPC